MPGPPGSQTGAPGMPWCPQGGVHGPACGQWAGWLCTPAVHTCWAHLSGTHAGHTSPHQDAHPSSFSDPSLEHRAPHPHLTDPVHPAPRKQAPPWSSGSGAGAAGRPQADSGRAESQAPTPGRSPEWGARGRVRQGAGAPGGRPAGTKASRMEPAHPEPGAEGPQRVGQPGPGEAAGQAGGSCFSLSAPCH